MVLLRLPSLSSWVGILTLIVTLLSLCVQSLAENSNQWIKNTDAQGQTVYLLNDRRPSLYTQNFGDCQGDSLINVTRFDAAYYKDNMTVLFHLTGNTAVANESLMLYIGVFAYGESRFDLTFNPCNANIYSLCPMNRSVPIEASGIIPVSQSDVAGIPPLALNIPDFEGQAILRIFANSTQSQIGCYSAVVSNGATFSQPKSVATILGIFTIVALVSSAAVAVYGDHIPTTRKHYAHSLSVFVVFSTFHHIYFTGALSMNWPSVLVAFWKNYAWSAGIIYTRSMQNSINQLTGSNRGNISIVGAAPSGETANNLGGGYQISQIYRRSTEAAANIFDIGVGIGQNLRPREFEHTLARRALANSSSGFSWYGSPVQPGLPLPGNFSGFAGTLAEEGIPASNAFMTSFLWFLILVAGVALGICLLKWVIESLIRMRWMKSDHLTLFRSHWLAFIAAAVLRTMLIAFFMFMFLTMFQFTLGGSSGVTAIAAIAFVILFVGMFAVTGYALFYRLRHCEYASDADRLNLEKTTKLGFVPWWKISFTGHDPQQPDVPDDEDYTRKFGWLTSRYRRSRWWFFAAWLLYEFVRACFYGGAAGHPMTQVFGLLAVETLSLVFIVSHRPFEGQRLNVLMIYILGFSKVATVALSSAFDPRFNLNRITTTVIGIVIIVIQGILTICLLIGVVLGAATSWMSVHRNQEECKPKSWSKIRIRYFAHVDQRATDLPKPPPISAVPEGPQEPYFHVGSVKRIAKIEDEELDEPSPDGNERTMSRKSPVPASHTASLRSTTSYSNLPYGARPHRSSWSNRDFSGFHDNKSGPLVRMSDASLRETARRQRAASRAGHSRTGSLTGVVEQPHEMQNHRSTRSTGGMEGPVHEDQVMELKESEIKEVSA